MEGAGTLQKGDNDDADEGRDRKQEFTDLLHGVEEAGGGKGSASKYSGRDLGEKSVAQLRRKCEDEETIQQGDIDDADEARDRKQAFTDLPLSVTHLRLPTSRRSKFSGRALAEKSDAQLRRMCESEETIKQEDIHYHA